MGYWGKIIGGAAGFFVGGPYGAVIGAALGHAADSGTIQGVRMPFGQEVPFTPARVAGMFGRKEEIFGITVTILAAKLCKADGPVKRTEIDAFKRNFRISPESARTIGRLFDQARDSAEPFEPYAAQLGATFSDNRGTLEEVLKALFVIARADGPLNGREQDYLRGVHRGLGLDEVAWNQRIWRSASPVGHRRRRSISGTWTVPFRQPRRIAHDLEAPDAGESPRYVGGARRSAGFRGASERQGGAHQCRLGPDQAGARTVNHRPAPSWLREVAQPHAVSDRPALAITDLPSPNHDARPDGVPIDMLILHYTGMKSAREAIERLRDPMAQVSAHYVVDEDGSVVRLVPETRRAWHAGVSHWRGHAALNGRSIGIEIVNPGHEWGYRDFPVLQMAALCDLCLTIMARHPIAARNVIGHSDVAPDRKEDPGRTLRLAGAGGERRRSLAIWRGRSGRQRSDSRRDQSATGAGGPGGDRLSGSAGRWSRSGLVRCGAGFSTALAAGSHHRAGG